MLKDLVAGADGEAAAKLRAILKGLEGPVPPVEPFAAARKRLEQAQRKRIAMCRDIVRATKRRDEYAKALAAEEAKLAKLQTDLGESDSELAEAQAEVERMAAQAAAPPTADAVDAATADPIHPGDGPDDGMSDVDPDTAAREQELLAKRAAADAELAQRAAKRTRRRPPTPTRAPPTQADAAGLAKQLQEVQQQANAALAAAPASGGASSDGAKRPAPPSG